MTATTKRRLIFLAAFSAYFIALWLAWNTVLIYPLKLFVVLLHELSHGVVAVATGGTIQAITLSPQEGGSCLCPGGSAFLTLSAGYLGSLGWGAVLLESSRLEGRWPRLALGGTGVVVFGLALFFVGNAFGIIFSAAFGLALLAAARFLPPRAARPILVTLGLTSCLYALLDIKSDIFDRPWLPSDARMLAELTGVHTLVWGVLWIAIALAASALLFRRAYRQA
jgi:hypothetical protein